MPNKSLLTSFCHCIKQVRKTLKGEKSAIAICVKSVLHSRGKTIKLFQCKTRKGKKAFLKTQPHFLKKKCPKIFTKTIGLPKNLQINNRIVQKTSQKQ